MIVGHIGGSSSGGYEIQKSLRFRASASAYLSRTPLSSSNRRTWTFSAHIKRGALGARAFIFSAGTATTNDAVFTSLEFAADSSLRLSGGVTEFLKTSLLYRDCSAAYHLVCSVDTTKATAQDRIKLFINGVQLTSFSTANYPAQNSELAVNYNWATYIGAYFGGLHFDGYLSEINFIDGQALDPSYFGQVSAETGAWIPKKYTGTYGTNGFYLPFNDGSTLANLTTDRSGNGNNWTANNISLTAGVTYDWMDDTPTNNFAVLNPIDRSNASMTVSAGNLDVSTFATLDVVRSSFTLSSGKWYWEITGTSTYTGLGVSRMDVPVGSSGHTTANGWYVFADTGNKWTNNSGSAYISGGYSGTDVIGIALDCDVGTITFYKNNTSQGTAFTGLAGLPLSPGVTTGLSVSTAKLNFGQRPFAYSPPAGFKALCTKNLPLPSILNPKKHFDVLMWSSTAAVKDITGSSFQPDLVWNKSRSSNSANEGYHHLVDVVRGAGKVLSSNGADAEYWNGTNNSVPAFLPTGFTAGLYDGLSGNAMVSWLWKAGGAAVANNVGTIASQVSANPAAGFSIVTYTGTGANATVGHGLGVAPKFIVFKSRDVARNWLVETTASGSFQYAYLNLTNSALSQPHASPTSAVMTLVSGAPEFNQSGEKYVAYCFAEIPGYSKISSYTGNGSADGPFVYCGFRPRFVLIKRVDAGEDWIMFDAARNPSNAVDLALFAHSSRTEYVFPYVDITSNGFKLRNTGTGSNSSGGSYIFYAVAEQPFQFANAR